MKSHEFPTAVCLLRNRFHEHCSHGREIKSVLINKQEKDISFCCHSMYNLFQDTEQIFQYHSCWLHHCCQLQFYQQSRILSQYETSRLAFIGDTSFSFKYASSGVISVWHNLHSDLTLSQTSSDDEILSTVGKIFGNTLFKTLDTWSVRLGIPPNAFVSLHSNGCMYDVRAIL